MLEVVFHSCGCSVYTRSMLTLYSNRRDMPNFLAMAWPTQLTLAPRAPSLMIQFFCQDNQRHIALWGFSHTPVKLFSWERVVNIQTGPRQNWHALPCIPPGKAKIGARVDCENHEHDHGPLVGGSRRINMRLLDPDWSLLLCDTPGCSPLVYPSLVTYRLTVGICLTAG